jgi:hypothetical protein
MRTYRVAAAAGVGSFLLALLELLGPGFPGSGDPAGDIDSYFVDHRSWMLSAVALQGVQNLVWTVFLCGFAWFVITSGSPTGGLVGVVSGALNVAVSLSGLSCIAALAYGVAGTGDPQMSKALFTIASMTLVISNFMLAGMAAGFAASAVLPRAFRAATGAIAVVFLVGGAALARRGAFSPDGAVQFATYAAELLWTLAAGILLWRTSSSSRHHVASTAFEPSNA